MGMADNNHDIEEGTLEVGMGTLRFNCFFFFFGMIKCFLASTTLGLDVDGNLNGS